MEEMATMYPTTIDELARISGVSRGKAIKFGKPFIELIAEYVEENDIEKPMDLLVRGVVNKSANKIYVIQNIDKKIPLDAIAKGKNMSMNELIAEMESIVSSGTKLNIDYYLEDLFSEDQIDEVFDYLRSSQSDSIDDAVNALGKENYTFEDVQLIRLKFMSEMAH